jgi:thioredoxin-related protein
MKRSLIITFFIAAFLGVFLYYSFTQITPQEIENAPDWLTIEEALEKAEEDGRLIVIDIFEVGCQFCRAMNRDVYPAPSTRAVIDRDFHPVKINGNSDDKITFLGEEMSEKEFANRMGLTAFPFTVIIDSRGNVIDSRRGYLGVAEITRFMRNAREKVTEG